MKTYQTLTLVGCIIGILLMLGLLAFVGVGSMLNDVALNMTKQSGAANQQELAKQQQQHAANAAVFHPMAIGLVVGLILYVILIPITLISRNTKAVGAVLMILGAIAMFAGTVWGVIPFALLLPAGILAIRYNKKYGDKALAE